LAIDNNRLTLLIVLVIIAAGVQTFITMPRAYDPGFIIRAAQVVTYFPGASPERVEQLVSSRLEEVIKEIPELDFVTSESRTGISIITVNIKESYKQMRPIWDNLRRKVEGAQGDLPDGVAGPFVNDEFGDVYGIVFTIIGEGFSYAELNEIAEDVRDRLQRLPDAAKVDILGEQEERIFIEFDNARLSELNISPYQLSQYLETRNIVLSGGSFVLGRERITLEPSGNFESINDIKQTILKLPGTDRLIYLKDLAKISHGYVDPPSSLVHSSGVRALALAVAMREGGNNIELGEQVSGALGAFNRQYPYGVEFDVINFAPWEVDKKVKGFVTNLFQAVVIVTLVMLFTLKLRTGLIVSSLIPLSMLLSLIVMSLFDIGLDQISLAALIIALGMLVDNGIVMSENILVQMEKGKSALQAALDSSAELRVPLLTASLTTAAAFLPIYLAESNVGEFTASLFKVVTITLLCSWIISLTVIPMLCVYILKVASKQENFSGRFYTFYQGLLSSLLAHRLITLVVVTVLGGFIVVGGFQFLPKVFFPPSDRTYFKVELELPAGTDIATTRDLVAELETFLAQELSLNTERSAGVTNWISYIGNAGPKFLLSHNPKPSNPGYALMIVNVSDVARIGDYMGKIRHYALDHFPDLDIKTRLIEEGPAVDNPVEIRLSGSNNDLLFKAVEAVKQQMHAMGGLTSISDNWGQRIKKLAIRIDQARALRVGVTSQDIAVSLQAGLSGMELTEYRQGEEIIPVLLRSQAANQQDISKVESLAVYVQSTGKSIPLRQVADIELVWDRAKILRRNGLRTVTVGAQLDNGITASEKFTQLLPWLQQRQRVWQNAVRYELGGESESSGKANQSIVDKLPIAGFIIMILLVGQFNSLRRAMIILLTIPMGLIGVIPGLLLANSFFGFMTLLGIISLAGIVINNAIVLLERIQIERDKGLEHLQAIVSAAQQRARPILLTTATTVLGLMPLYLGGGEMWEPMAVTIMAGLLFSTVLTLGVAPVLYAVLFRVKSR
jgi:multidrug efflux pump subunit AcrB